MILATPTLGLFTIHRLLYNTRHGWSNKEKTKYLACSVFTWPWPRPLLGSFIIHSVVLATMDLDFDSNLISFFPFWTPKVRANSWRLVENATAACPQTDTDTQQLIWLAVPHTSSLHNFLSPPQVHPSVTWLQPSSKFSRIPTRTKIPILFLPRFTHYQTS